MKRRITKQAVDHANKILSLFEKQEKEKLNNGNRNNYKYSGDITTLNKNK